MAQYLVQFNQTSETWGKLIKHPEDRRKAFGAQVEKLGGKLLGYWYTFGKHHGLLVVEMPDNVAMLSLLAPIAPSRGVHSATQPLITVDEKPKAMKHATDV